MNQTQNYQLSQWERTDKVQMDDFNADNAKIDEALAGLAQTAAAHSALLSKLGNCRIEHIPYVGRGRYGQDNPTTITFSRPPLFFIVVQITGILLGSQHMPQGCVISTESYGASANGLALKWNGNTVSFYHTSDARKQFDLLNFTYHVFAFHAEDAD